MFRDDPYSNRTASFATHGGEVLAYKSLCDETGSNIFNPRYISPKDFLIGSDCLENEVLKVTFDPRRLEIETRKPYITEY